MAASSLLQLPTISSSMLLLLIVTFLISTASSQVCKSQNFVGSRHYPKCIDLPTLNAFLHWSYDPNKSTLAIVFIAPPAKPEGWIAWALNPNRTGMVGAQAILAYKASNGLMDVKTYNISSYSSVVESKLWYNVMHKRAEWSSASGMMRIFAQLALPAGETLLNQVWQVGSAMTNGVPKEHEFQTSNLDSKSRLDIVHEGLNQISAAPAHAPSPGPSGSGSATGPSTDGKTGTGSSGATRRNGGLMFGFYGFFLLFGILVLYGF